MNRRATLQVEAAITNVRRSSIFDLSGCGGGGKRALHELGQSILALGVAPSDHELEFNVKPQVEYENTFRMEPKQRFVAERLEPIMKDVLERHLEKMTYDPVQCGHIAKTVVAEIKTQVKDLNFERYKLVCMVDIGEKRDQDVHMGSRCLWDSQRDTFASVSFENHSLFATAIVFAVYFE